jgi:hypothetical protein
MYSSNGKVAEWLEWVEDNLVECSGDGLRLLDAVYFCGDVVDQHSQVNHGSVDFNAEQLFGRGVRASRLFESTDQLRLW